MNEEETERVLGNLAVRLERLENAVLEIAKDQTINFLIKEVLKDKSATYLMRKKIGTTLRFVNKRITDLNNSHHGLVAYLHENKKDAAHKKAYKF